MNNVDKGNFPDHVLGVDGPGFDEGGMKKCIHGPNAKHLLKPGTETCRLCGLSIYDIFGIAPPRREEE